MAMNITIEQTDIESSIETYVRSMIPGLSPETVVDIDLAATRGPAGFTATIRLLSPQEASSAPVEAPAAPAPVAEEKPKQTRVKTSATKPLNIAAKAAEAKAAAPAEEATAETAEETQTEEEAARAADAIDLNAPAEATDEPTEEAEEDQAEDVAEDTPAEAAATEQPDAPVEEAPRKSLFKNLAKPQN